MKVTTIIYNYSGHSYYWNISDGFIMKNSTYQFEFGEKLKQLLALLCNVLNVDRALVCDINSTDDKPLFILHKNHGLNSNDLHQYDLFIKRLLLANKEDISINDIKVYADTHPIDLLPIPSQLHSIYVSNFSTNKRMFKLCLTHKNEIELSIDQKELLKVFIDNISNLLNNSFKESFSFSIDQDNSQTLFEQLFHSVPEAISIHELPSNNIIAANVAFLKHTGYSEKEIINKKASELNLWHNEEDRNSFNEILNREGVVRNFASKFRMRNGDITDGLVASKVFELNKTPYVMVIITDISPIINIQNELTASEKKFRNVFNFLPDPVSINRLDDTMAFTDMNQAFLEAMGRETQDLLGKSGFSLNMWDDKEQRAKYIQKINTDGEVNNMQARYRFKNGELVDGLISAKTIEIDQHPHLLVILKNIDHIIQIKKALKQSEEKFRRIFDASPDAININKVKSGEFIDVNKSFTEITGYQKDELLGKTLFDFTFIENKEDYQYYRKELEAKNDISNLETSIRLKNGTIIRALISATIIKIEGQNHILNVSRNIDDIKNNELGLIESENKFRTIVEKSHATICIIDDKSTFVYTNPQAEQLFGYPTKELIGHQFSKFIHPDSLDLVQKRYKKRQQSQQPPELYEFKIVRKNGEERDVEISSSVYVDKEGKTKTIAQLLDITDRNKAVIKASFEQQKTQQYLNIAAFMMIALDLNGNVEMVNNKACEILGYDKTEIIGKNWFSNFIPSSIIEITKNRYQSMVKTAGEVLTSENKIVTKTQLEKTIAWHSTPILNESNETVGILSSGEDITERLNTLRILDKSKVVAILWKYNSHSNIHPIEYVSNNIKRLIGYTKEELVNNNIRYIDLIHPDDLEKVLTEVDSYTSEGKHQTYYHEYYRLRTKDGSWIWVEDQTKLIKDGFGNITHLSGLLIDVTEKQKSLEIIKENEERYRVIFNSNLDGLVIFNFDGVIIDVNQVICQLYGWDYDEVLNRTDPHKINIASGFDLDSVKTLLLTSDVLESESLETRKNGSQFYINAKLRWINYKNEKHILVVIKDISQKKADEIELIKAKEKAEESDQLKSAFLANMSHEIRTPMNSIIGFSSLLEDEISEEEKRSFISRIKDNSQQLLSLINDIIDISKIEANQINFYYDYINMKEFFMTLHSSFQIEAKNNSIDFRYKVPETEFPLEFKTDTNRLRQVLTNLLSNAFKFTPKGGVIEFGYHPDSDGMNWLLYVKDNGIGIAKDAQKNVFDRFRQAHKITHANYGGTGLGLSISKGIVENLGGRIWLESDLHEGAKFYFTLPKNTP